MEWHVTPDYVAEHWSDELLALMCEKLGERKEREIAAIKSKGSSANKVPDEQLFKMGNKMFEVKKSGNSDR